MKTSHLSEAKKLYSSRGILNVHPPVVRILKEAAELTAVICVERHRPVPAIILGSPTLSSGQPIVPGRTYERSCNPDGNRQEIHRPLYCYYLYNGLPAFFQAMTPPSSSTTLYPCLAKAAAAALLRRPPRQ